MSINFLHKLSCFDLPFKILDMIIKWTQKTFAILYVFNIQLVFLLELLQLQL